VACFAGNVPVGPVKLETGIVVVEFVCRPFFKSMADRAIGVTIPVELSVMDVLVATGAPVAQPGKLLHNRTVLCFAEMAGPAGLPLMGTLELKLCFRMIEPDLGPPAFGMAAFTSSFGIIFLIEIRLMDVLVTVHATHTDVPEIPPFLFLVADKTGCGLVRPFQGERAGVVFLKGVERTLESFHGVAGGTVGRPFRFFKLSKVVIGMTVFAQVMIQGIGIAGLVAGLAVQEPVPALQQVTRFAVVESRHFLDHMERDF